MSREKIAYPGTLVKKLESLESDPLYVEFSLKNEHSAFHLANAIEFSKYSQFVNYDKTWWFRPDGTLIHLISKHSLENKILAPLSEPDEPGSDWQEH